ncbi:hypothetical protein HN371_28770 [Candidatus Poribacteria bacterium]|nr:hypothetical protein [Candidatus Poribacteria bacterium]MBT5531734.1 hypothetical protein [Candidatus Poribacteria bacterium]MBT5714738.1 hypothetical protein [Candidatus Poribacteria bacterium]MBT7095825.1 hypothetical protein [Candidatus Poribacteria bacterium]MBT7805521.1 hypothetical protein [Candidatus Poribacteria bacterium]
MDMLSFTVAMSAIVLGCGVGFAWALVEYSSRKQKLTAGASATKIEEMQRQIDALGEDMRGVQEALADVTLLVEDSARGRLGPSDDTD